MPSQIFLFDPVERFVVGTVGVPGERTFFIQARTGSRLISVALEKSQVAAIADRVLQILREIRHSEPLLTFERVAPDDNPLETPIDEEFRVGVIGLAYVSDRRLIEIDLQAIAESDLGSFYTDKTGFVKFEDRNTIARRLLSPFIRFSDVPSVEGYDYQVFDVSYDDSLIANDVSVDSGGDVQQATDATSIATYFKRSMSKTGLLIENDTDALLMAQTILSSRKDPTVRITIIGIDITKAPSIKDQQVLTSVLGTEFGQPIIVTKNWYQVDPDYIGFNPTSLSDLLTVQGISHTIRPDRWVVEFTTAQPLLSSFILDDSSNGEFGDILYY
jgi:uncharacterized repeat protein (TIGR03847 family)